MVCLLSQAGGKLLMLMKITAKHVMYTANKEQSIYVSLDFSVVNKLI